MGFWEKVKEELAKGAKEGLEAVKEGASIVKEKAGILSEEGKKKLRLYELRNDVKKEMAELGARAFDLVEEGKDVASDDRVRGIVSVIKDLKSKIETVEKEK